MARSKTSHKIRNRNAYRRAARETVCTGLASAACSPEAAAFRSDRMLALQAGFSHTSSAQAHEPAVSKTVGRLSMPKHDAQTKPSAAEIAIPVQVPVQMRSGREASRSYK